MSSEAGPSSPPLFKKRGKANTTRISSSVIDDPAPTPSTSITSNQEDISVQDLIALRSLSRKPTGIELERLNKGERKNKTKATKSAAQLEEERWEAQMKHGGLMSSRNPAAGQGDEQESDNQDGSNKGARLVRKNNFQGETGTVDVDKHMMAYIEDEMRKRTGTTSSLTESQLRSAISNPEDDLYAVAEKYKALSRSIKPEQTQEEREGNVALSTAMLSSIPEVDLGIDSRMKNIEDTERAKRKLAEAGGAKVGLNGADDEAYANARFMKQHPRTNNSDFPGASRPGEGGGEKKQLATDQLVLDRFKKRQRNFR